MRTALGFTIKSGWACGVALSGPVTAPQVLVSRRLELSDPSDLRARQPHHASAGKSRPPGRELDRLLASVRKFGERSVADFVADHERGGYTADRAGLVVGSLIDPARIGNEHIRIHALEGQLFRGIVADGLTRCRVSSSIWRERDIYGLARERLRRSEAAVRTTLANLGRNLEGPWRAEHKLAALAAWLVLFK